jgi:hypothetical protein
MVPEFGDRPIIIIEQGRTAERVLNAFDETIDNMTTTVSIFLLQTESL